MQDTVRPTDILVILSPTISSSRRTISQYHNCDMNVGLASINRYNLKHLTYNRIPEFVCPLPKR